MDKIRSVDAQAATDISQFDRGVKRAESIAKSANMDEKAVTKAAGGFEALMLHEMLKEMWATVNTTGLLGEDSNQAGIYRDMLNQAIADNIAEGRGIGVKSFLKKELVRYQKHQTS